MSHENTVYATESLRTYLEDAASGKPAPGGGSVSACVGALGAALVSMVGNLTAGKEKFAVVEEQAREMVREAGVLRARLEDLLQEDTVAYNGVIAAYRLPKETEAERAVRAKAVQDGLLVAAGVPLDICRAAIGVCRLAQTAVEIGNPAAVTDAGIGAVLGEAAAVGAALNVRINLGSITDEEYCRRTGEELERLLAEASSLRAAVVAATEQML